MDPTLAALLGAALGVAGTVASTQIQTRREREAWWREQRMAVYAEFLEAIERGFRASTELGFDSLDARAPSKEAMKLAIARVELLGPPEVFAHALNVMNDTFAAIATDGAVPDLVDERFMSLQRFVHHSKIALGESGIGRSSRGPRMWLRRLAMPKR